MEKLSRDEWLDAIHDVAVDAANNYVKFVEQYDTPAEGLDEKVIGDIEKFLQKKYPYEQVSNEDIEVLTKFTPESVWKWEVHGKADGDEYDPRAKHEAAELAKYMPFLKGVAPEGNSWMDGRQDLKLIGSQLGFDYNREGLGKFLNKLSKYQTVYDRANIMKEMRNSPFSVPFFDVDFGPSGAGYWTSKLVYPSLTEGIENAVSTGSDLSKGQAVGLGLLDAGANAAMFGIPGASASRVSSPVAAGVLDAVVQGGLEADRQGLKTVIDPTLEADPRQAVMASLFGSTRPAIVGSAQGIVSKVPTKSAMEFSRGIGKATRAGNPVAAEKETIMEMVKNHNNLIANNAARDESFARMILEGEGKPVTKENIEKLFKYLGDDPVIQIDKSVADTEKMLGTERVDEMAKFLGVKADEKGMYNVDEFMNAYDRKPVYTWKRVGNKTEIFDGDPKSYHIPGFDDGMFQLTPELAVKYKSLFPAKYADEAGASKIRAAGLKAGEILGAFGGRFEPTFKLNPLNVGPQTFPEYTKQDWYLRLGPKSRAIIDEAFKKKMEEEASPYYLDVE